MSDNVYLSAVAPVFNEESSLAELYAELSLVLKKMGETYEIIFVDDGSSDRSPVLLSGFAAADNNVKVVTFCRNFGQHAAVMAGFKTARGDIMVTLDADLQNPPYEIPKLVKKIEEGFDVVSGWRAKRKDTFARRAVSGTMNLIISSLTGVKLHDYGCMLRAYRRPIIKYLVEYGEKSVYIPAFTSWISRNVAEVEIGHNIRKYGKSKYSLLKFLRQAFDLITAYTLVPIQIISITGAVFAIVGFFLACYLMSFRLFFGTTSTLTTFISALLIFSGLMLFSLGIVSEYLARIYVETRKMPLYIIKAGQ